MQIFVNGDRREFPTDLTAAQLIETLGLSGKRLALEVNQEIVPRSTFNSHRFRDGDQVEIVHAIGGG
jgi:sulfur carrier protein